MAFAAAAFIAMRANAAGAPTQDALFALPLALWPYLRGALLFVVLPVLIVVTFLRQPIASVLRRFWPGLEERLPALFADSFSKRLEMEYSAQPAPRRPVGLWRRTPAPADLTQVELPENAEDFPDEIKHRMREIHRTLRDAHPVALPLFADYRAMQNRLLAEIALHPAGRGYGYRHLAAGLEKLEAETRKVSVVLPGATKEYGLDDCSVLLEQLTGEAMGCLCKIRLAKRAGAGSGQSITGEIQPL